MHGHREAAAVNPLAARTNKPHFLVDLICHHINKPEMPQRTISALVASTPTAQIQRESTRPGKVRVLWS